MRKHKQVVQQVSEGILGERKGRGLSSVSMCAPKRVVNTRTHEEEHGPAVLFVYYAV